MAGLELFHQSRLWFYLLSCQGFKWFKGAVICARLFKFGLPAAFAVGATDACGFGEDYFCAFERRN